MYYMVSLPNEIFKYILSLVPRDRNCSDKTSNLIKTIKAEMEMFIENYLYIVENSPSHGNAYYLTFSRFYFIYKKFRTFEKYFLENRMDQRLVLHRFLLYV
jgi:hypothetical protein